MPKMLHLSGQAFGPTADSLGENFHFPEIPTSIPVQVNRALEREPGSQKENSLCNNHFLLV